MPQTSSSPHSSASPVSPAQLREFIAGIDTLIDLKKLEDDTPFRDAGADSLDFFTLVIAIQETYGITIADNDIGKATTLAKLANYLNERLA
jgi:acyl carrier protein